MTEFTPRDPGFEQRTRDSFARQAFMATLGAETMLQTMIALSGKGDSVEHAPGSE